MVTVISWHPFFSCASIWSDSVYFSLTNWTFSFAHSWTWTFISRKQWFCRIGQGPQLIATWSQVFRTNLFHKNRGPYCLNVSSFQATSTAPQTTKIARITNIEKHFSDTLIRSWSYGINWLLAVSFRNIQIQVNTSLFPHVLLCMPPLPNQLKVNDLYTKIHLFKNLLCNKWSWKLHSNLSPKQRLTNDNMLVAWRLAKRQLKSNQAPA